MRELLSKMVKSWRRSLREWEGTLRLGRYVWTCPTGKSKSCKCGGGCACLYACNPGTREAEVGEMLELAVSLLYVIHRFEANQDYRTRPCFKNQSKFNKISQVELVRKGIWKENKGRGEKNEVELVMAVFLWQIAYWSTVQGTHKGMAVRVCSNTWEVKAGESTWDLLKMKIKPKGKLRMRKKVLFDDIVIYFGLRAWITGIYPLQWWKIMFLMKRAIGDGVLCFQYDAEQSTQGYKTLED